MSLDVTIYFKGKPPQSSFCTACGDGWLVSVDGPFRVSKTDIDPNLLNYVTNRNWLIELHLEGAASREDLAELKRLQDKGIREFEGIAFLHQSDVVISKEGTSSVVRIAETAANASYSLGMFFERADLVSKESIEFILDTIAAILPEGLPHRYGEHEPLQEKWTDGGKARFLELWDRRETLFCRGKTPVIDVSMSFDYFLGRDLGEFRCGKFEFCFRNSILRSPLKLAAAFHIFGKLLPILNPFYAGFLEEEHMPGPRWKGVPGHPHTYLILGEPMLALWPEFTSLSKHLETGHRIFMASQTVPSLLPPNVLQEPTEKNPNFNGGQNGEYALRPSGKYAAQFPFPKTDPYWKKN